jgi:hypothetical protein
MYSAVLYVFNRQCKSNYLLKWYIFNVTKYLYHLFLADHSRSVRVENVKKNQQKDPVGKNKSFGPRNEGRGRGKGRGRGRGRGRGMKEGEEEEEEEEDEEEE